MLPQLGGQYLLGLVYLLGAQDPTQHLELPPLLRREVPLRKYIRSWVKFWPSSVLLWSTVVHSSLLALRALLGVVGVDFTASAGSSCTGA